MQVGRMKSEEEAQKFIESRLLEVKEILDEIADQTGVTFLCLGEEVVEAFGRYGMVMRDALNAFEKCGMVLSNSLISIMKIVPDRLDLANKAMEVAYKANKENEAKAAHRDDLFAGASKMEGSGRNDAERAG